MNISQRCTKSSSLLLVNYCTQFDDITKTSLQNIKKKAVAIATEKSVPRTSHEHAIATDRWR